MLPKLKFFLLSVVLKFRSNFSQLYIFFPLHFSYETFSNIFLITDNTKLYLLYHFINDKINNMKFIKKNFLLLFAFLLPIVLIATVALSTYFPSLFLSTSYNFIYMSCDYRTNYSYAYNCENYLQKSSSVVNNKFTLNNVDPTLDSDNNKIPDINENYTTRIFLHDTQKNESREIALEEAQKLTLNNLLTSPDGVTVSNHFDRSSGDFFFIFGDNSSSYDYYLTKGKNVNKLNLINNNNLYYYQNNFKFVGWVLPGRN